MGIYYKCNKVNAIKIIFSPSYDSRRVKTPAPEKAQQVLFLATKNSPLSQPHSAPPDGVEWGNQIVGISCVVGQPNSGYILCSGTT